MVYKYCIRDLNACIYMLTNTVIIGNNLTFLKKHS